MDKLKQFDFEGNIKRTHISEDKRDLYVLIELPCDNKIEIHAVNLVDLISYKICMLSDTVSHFSVLDNRLILFDDRSGILRLVPFERLDDRSTDFINYIRDRGQLCE